MGAIAEIFRRHGPQYLELYGDRMVPSHRKALSDILECRTEAGGGHVFECDRCGKLHYAYHSCRNRSCPQCHGKQTEAWLDKGRKELLPVPYFHVVLTLPAELREIVRSNREILLSALMQAAAASLTTLAKDPRFVGGTISILSVLHTWTRALITHPHVHCPVPGGGLAPDRASRLAAHDGYLVPVRALSQIFLAQFVALARKRLPGIELPQSIWKKEWVVYTKPTVQGSETVLQYLGRYVRRIAISNCRILSFEDGRVTFRYKDWRAREWKTATLSAEEFVRRYLQHVLPRGFHKVRSYGLLSPANRALLDWARFLLTGDEDSGSDEAAIAAETADVPKETLPLCPHCGVGRLIPVGRLPPGAGGPP
jgi:hypothetical protein